MTLVFSTDRSVYKHLNRSLMKIHKNLWAGQLTLREIERLKIFISIGNHKKTRLFKSEGEEILNYFEESLDLLYK